MRVSPLVPKFLRVRFGFMCPYNYNNYQYGFERLIGITLYVNDHDEPDVKRVKEDGRFFGSWFATEMAESIEMWEKIYLDPSGIDIVFTNRPVPATKARDMLQPEEPRLDRSKINKKKKMEKDEIEDYD